MEIIEEFINGFCKAQNQSRMVLCEFQVEEDGTKTFLESDCAYGTCSYSRQCQLMAGVEAQQCGLLLGGKTLNEPGNVTVNSPEKCIKFTKY